MERPERSISADSVPLYHTCLHCQKLVAVFHDRDIGEFEAESYNILFEATYEDVSSAATEECKLCQYLVAESPLYKAELYQKIILAASVVKEWEEIEFMWWNWETKSKWRQIGRSFGISISACKSNFTRLYHFPSISVL
jgi:hypothetical protein